MRAPHRALDALLDGPSRWRAIEHHDEVTSTNDVAAERVASGAAPGLVVVADSQTAGRGRRARRWEDHPGGSLLASCLVAAPEALTLVPLAAGLALHHAIRRAGVDAALKWPNDVLAGGRKCAGILVENLGHGDPPAVVVGIGVDLDWRGVERSGEATTWTSIAEVTGRPVDRWEFLADLLAALDSWLGDLDRDPAVLLALYRQHCATIGAAVEVDTPGGRIAGRAEDVADSGALLVRRDGDLVEVTAGDVVHLDASG